MFFSPWSLRIISTDLALCAWEFVSQLQSAISNISDAESSFPIGELPWSEWCLEPLKIDTVERKLLHAFAKGDGSRVEGR